MKRVYQFVGLPAALLSLALTSGCIDPDGRQDNTGTGALIGGAVGALAGAATGGRHAGEHALIGALAGVVAGGLVGHMIDEQQKERLRTQYPQTYQTIQYNDRVAAQPPPPAQLGQPTPAPVQTPTALKVSDIEALTAAGVKPDAIINAIKESKANGYSATDIAAAQQANPPVDPTVVAYMKNPTT